MKKIIIIFIFIPILLSAQEEENKSTKDGWAIHIGAGFMYGGNIGFLIEKQILFKEKFRISPFSSIGFTEGGTDTTEQSG